MSVYEFICEDCKKRFELVKPISDFDPRSVKCPKCGKKNVRRIWGDVQVHTAKKS